MLIELHVANLGVIESLTLRPGERMTAVTGETGAGKTLIVGAIALLAGGRAEAGMVRPGAAEAVVDGRFLLDGEEVVLSRVIPASGRSRAYRNGRPVTVGELAEIGARLIEIHGQHAHQQLLGPGAQRQALDEYAGIDTDSLDAAARRVRQLRADLEALGGDERSRAREVDLVGFQLRELDDAQLDDPGEEDALRELERRLADVGSLREVAAGAIAGLAADGGGRDRLATAAERLSDTSDGVLAAIGGRLSGLVAEVDEAIADLRAAADGLDDDPARLAEVQQRRKLLTGLRRKYGATLAAVIAEREVLRERLVELEGLDGRRDALLAELADAEAHWAAVAAQVGAARRAAAPQLASEVAERLTGLGMPHARLEVVAAAATDGRPDAGDDVTFLLSANPGVPAQPLARAASGGELSRTMLALRLVLSGGPPVAVFDEVDAGVGGEAAGSVAEALADVATGRQVLVVTHLAQVAARAGAHVSLTKETDGAVTTTVLVELERDGRVGEVARMLSGSPDSDTARRHAAELLDGIAAQRVR
jgi:DNA repair protein RecN (Recombination protein N)